MSLLNMWASHPTFENKAGLAKSLIQALQVDFERGGGAITKTSFDEALLEVACFREFQEFYDTLARRIQRFFRRHRGQMARRRKHARLRKKGKLSARASSPVRKPQSGQAPGIGTGPGPGAASSASAKVPPGHKTAPPGLADFFQHLSATRRSSPRGTLSAACNNDGARGKSSPSPLQQGGRLKSSSRPGALGLATPSSPGRSPRHGASGGGRTHEQISRALHAYFPPLPAPLASHLRATGPLDPSGMPLVGPEGRAFDQSFNRSMDYFHDSIMFNVQNLQLEDSECEDEERMRRWQAAGSGEGAGLHRQESTESSLSGYPAGGAGGDGAFCDTVNSNSQNRPFLFAPHRLNIAGHSPRRTPTDTVNLSIAASAMVVDEQIQRKITRHRDADATSQQCLNQFQSYHHHHASRIQELWRRGTKALIRSQRIRALTQFLKSEQKLVDSQSVKDALGDSLDSGNGHIATALFLRIVDIVKTYRKVTANDYSVYYPQTVDDLSLLVDILVAFVSLEALVAGGTQLFMSLIQKNPGEGGGPSPMVAMLGSAGACDYLMVALNRHANAPRPPPGEAEAEGAVARRIARAKMCRDAIELQVVLTNDCPDNQLRLTKKHHARGALAMLGVAERDLAYEVLPLALKFISGMCKTSTAACAQFRAVGLFTRVLNMLRLQYKVTEAIFTVFGFISVLIADGLEDEMFEESFCSAMSFVVYLDCLVAHRKSPQCFRLVCHVVHRLSRRGDHVLANLTSEYFAMAASAIMMDPHTDKECSGALLLLLKKLRGRYAPLNAMFEENGTNALTATLSISGAGGDFLNAAAKGAAAEVNMDGTTKLKDSRASSVGSNLFASESFASFVDHKTPAPEQEQEEQAAPPVAAASALKKRPQLVHTDSFLSSDKAIRRIQYLGINRFKRLKQRREFKESCDKADILVKLIPKSNYFDQIVDAFQVSLKIGHVELVALTLTRILSLIEESHQMQNASLVAKTFIKNPKILVDVASSFLSITKIQLLIWRIILHLPFKLDIKNEMDTLAMANVSGAFFWVIRRHAEDLGVVETCLACAARLTTASAIMQEKFGKESGLRVLVRVMTQHNDVLRPMLAATELVTNLCSASTKNQERCCAVGGVAHQLVQFLIKHMHNDRVVGAVAAALINICGMKRNQNILTLMSSRHLLLYVQIIKNNLNSVDICSHMCMMLTSLTSGLSGGIGESKMHVELQQSVVSVELVAILDKLANDSTNAKQEVVQTIIMLLVHLVLNFPTLRLKFLMDGALRVLPHFMTSAAAAAAIVSGATSLSRPSTRQSPGGQWSVPVTNSAKLAHSILLAEKSSHANSRAPSFAHNSSPA